MKAWIKFIPLILLISYCITYDVVDSMEHHDANTIAQQVISDD
ncbi:hypothetical protein [Vibrio methylphosphonaticus]|nr:hypothetical protein [Vibrio methylphosphonaticus]